MKKKKGIAIRGKLLISYFAFVIIQLTIGTLGIFTLRTVYKNGSKIYNEILMAIQYMTEIDKNVKEIDRSVLGMSSDFDEDFHEIYLERISNSRDIILNSMKSYEELEFFGREKEIYNVCKENIQAFDDKYLEIVDLINEGKHDEVIIKCEDELAVVKEKAYKSIEEIIDYEEELARQIEEDNRNIYSRIIWVFSIFAFCGVVAAVSLAAYMGNYFGSRLSSIQMLARRLSEYNASEDIKDMDNDEFGTTIKALNESQFMLRGFMEKVIAESQELSETGKDISGAIRKSEQRLEELNTKILEASKKTKNLDSDICESLEDVGTELTGIVTYLEQISITSDYQNDIANSHKEQVEKFKVD